MHKGYQKILETGRDPKSFSYVWLYIRCSKVQCKSCPHGPYLYARYRVGTKVRAIYIGKRVPEELKFLVSTP